MTESKNGVCMCWSEGIPLFIFACSGGADTGELSDRAAREMTKQGIGKMYCLAGIGGKISGILATTKAMSRILVIDGCGFECAKKILQSEGIEEFVYLCLSDIGFEKGNSPVSDKRIEMIVEEAKRMLQSEKECKS